MIKTSGTYAIFKGKGAAKFSIMHPRRGPARTLKSGTTAQGFIDKNGAILLEAAPTKGKRTDGLPDVDWSQKITFAIGVPDIANLLDPKTEKLFHKIGNVTKTLSIQPGTGGFAGTFNLYLNSKEGSQNQAVHVPLSAGEFSVLQRLLVSALPTLIGWQE
jgi:hypothetical protein